MGSKYEKKAQNFGFHELFQRINYERPKSETDQDVEEKHFLAAVTLKYVYMP